MISTNDKKIRGQNFEGKNSEEISPWTKSPKKMRKSPIVKFIIHISIIY